MQKITIPHYGSLALEHVVLDYNGTLAGGGEVDLLTRQKLSELTRHYRVYVITADTFGTVEKALQGLNLQVQILSSEDHSAEKAAFVRKLGEQNTVAVGNGNNDRMMLEVARLSIALMGEEGCATATLMASDIVCKSMLDAMSMLIEPKRLVATLRR